MASDNPIKANNFFSFLFLKAKKLNNSVNEIPVICKPIKYFGKMFVNNG